MSDLERLQGTWYVAALEMDGAESPFGAATVRIDGKRFVSSGMGGDYEGTLVLSTTKKPKTIDMIFTAGPPAGMTNRGIYKLDDEGWTLCLATRGDARPRAFTTKRDTGHALEHLTRAAPNAAKRTAKAAKAHAAPSGPPSAIDGEWTMISAVFSGAPLAPEMVKFCRRITGGGVTRIVAGNNTMLDASFTLDAARGHIDYVNRSGKSNGRSQAGIYELRGDSLRICTAAPGKARPIEFASGKGDGRSLTEWKRASE